VIPAPVLGALAGWPSADLPAALADLRQVAPVVLVEAPAAARRVTSEEDVRALEALTLR
jgi:2-C-methyl-D-erythritol 4-phosphate cytidylyltransferase